MLALGEFGMDFHEYDNPSGLKSQFDDSSEDEEEELFTSGGKESLKRIKNGSRSLGHRAHLKSASASTIPTLELLTTPKKTSISSSPKLSPHSISGKLTESPLGAYTQQRLQRRKNPGAKAIPSDTNRLTDRSSPFRSFPSAAAGQVDVSKQGHFRSTSHVLPSISSPLRPNKPWMSVPNHLPSPSHASLAVSTPPSWEGSKPSLFGLTDDDDATNTPFNGHGLGRVDDQQLELMGDHFPTMPSAHKEEGDHITTGPNTWTSPSKGDYSSVLPSANIEGSEQEADGEFQPIMPSSSFGSANTHSSTTSGLGVLMESDNSTEENGERSSGQSLNPTIEQQIVPSSSQSVEAADVPHDQEHQARKSFTPSHCSSSLLRHTHASRLLSALLNDMQLQFTLGEWQHGPLVCQDSSPDTDLPSTPLSSSAGSFSTDVHYRTNVHPVNHHLAAEDEEVPSSGFLASTGAEDDNSDVSKESFSDSCWKQIVTQDGSTEEDGTMRTTCQDMPESVVSAQSTTISFSGVWSSHVSANVPTCVDAPLLVANSPLLSTGHQEVPSLLSAGSGAS